MVKSKAAEEKAAAAAAEAEAEATAAAEAKAAEEAAKAEAAEVEARGVRMKEMMAAAAVGAIPWAAILDFVVKFLEFLRRPQMVQARTAAHAGVTEHCREVLVHNLEAVRVGIACLQECCEV